MTNRMIIGDRNRSVDTKSTEHIRLYPGDPAFEPIVTYLTSLLCFAAAAEVYNNQGRGAHPWAADDVAVFDGAACDVRLTWLPDKNVRSMLRNVWPSELIMVSHSAAPISQSTALPLGVFEHFIFGLGQAMLTTFFERHKKSIRGTFGGVSNWPPVWKFARVVRNAMSHGGRVRIDDCAQVQWHNLSYSSADNDRRVVLDDLWPADLFVFLNELQRALIHQG